MLRRIWVILFSICLCASVLIGCSVVRINNEKSETDNTTFEENTEQDISEEAEKENLEDAKNDNIEDDEKDSTEGNTNGDSEDGTKEMYKDKYEVTWDCGKFTGQIDNNSIEIQIIGKPDSFPPEAFRLEEEIKESFSDYKLVENDEIKFKYYINENEQKVIIYIEKY